MATRQPTEAINLPQNLSRLDPSTYPILTQALSDAAANFQPTQRSDIIFTDDRAPVETLINAMTIEFFLSGEVETLAPN